MYHNLGIEKVLERLKSSENGLTKEEAALRLSKYGLNKIPERKASVLSQFLKQFQNPLVVILIFAGGISLLLERLTDAAVILIAVLIAVILSFWQEFKATRISEALKQKLKKYAVVLRSKEEVLIEIEKLVPGDILILRAGDTVGADARIIENFHLKINEAVLTGESMAVSKAVNVLPLDTQLAERKNMVFAGTLIEEGSGKAVITGTGLATEFGKIASQISSIEEKKSPLQKDISRLAKILGGIIVASAGILFWVGFYRNLDLLDTFLTLVAVAVAAVPEGLPAATSVVLAIGMSRILKKQGLVKKVLAVETLGRTSIILTDKTGTLTKAQMQVSKIFNSENNLLILKIGALTSEAFIENPQAPSRLPAPDAAGIDGQVGQQQVVGRPTEKALVFAAAEAGLNKEELLKNQPRLDFLPFNPERKLAASLHLPQHRSKKKQNILYAAGAPEIIFNLATRIYQNKKTKPLNKEAKKELEEKIKETALQGERIIAFAFRETKISEIPDDYFQLIKNLTFAGFISFTDPLREEVAPALEITKKAGLRTIIITGDHLLTAQKIAENLGLKIKEDEALSGQELEKLDDYELEKIISKIKLYYRTAPSQKLRIVKTWQKRGEVVAMVGDGVNDAPAIKKADAGVAVGSGTDVAKEAADLILINDSFGTIVAAIRESRIIIDNIRKTITYLLSTTFTEIFLIGLSLLAGLPLPVLPGQILWANLVEEGPLSFAFAFEPAGKGLMRKERIISDRSIFTKQMRFLISLITITSNLILFLLFLTLLKTEFDFNRLRTIIFMGLSIDAIFFVWPLKDFKKPFWKINILNNKYLLAATGVSIFLLVLAVTLGPLQSILRTVTPSPLDWLIVLTLGVIDLFLIESGKRLFRKWL